MVLAIDIGNTNTVIGVFDNERLVDFWRISTVASRTADEVAIALKDLFALSGFSNQLKAGIFASVVPATIRPFREALKKWFGLDALTVTGFNRLTRWPDTLCK